MGACVVAAILNSCTEIYVPNINTDKEALVVEGLITDSDGPYTVKLSQAQLYTSDESDTETSIAYGAAVTITDNDNYVYPLTETSAGVYVTDNSFKAVVGKKYQLHITTKDGVEYESSSERLLAPESYDSIRAFTTTQDYVDVNSDVVNVKGADVRMNLFTNYSSADSVYACRFETQLVYQYWYTYRDRDINGNEIMTYHWVNFGWKKFMLNTTNNITEEKSPSASPAINNHSLCFVPYDALNYGLIIPTPTIIYYLKVKQYSMNHDSYRFYEAANDQLSAGDKLFDPISSQLYGNIKCVTDSSKLALGLFEVSSVKYHAFVLELTDWQNTVTVRKTSYIDIPDNSYYQYRIWEALSGKPENDSTYNVIPLPSWWYHY